MPVLPLSLIAVGLIIIIYPDFIAYFIGFIFLSIGINLLIMMTAFRKNNPERKWSFGSYEIIKKNKND